MSRYALRSRAAARSGTQFRVSANARVPRAFVALPALLLVLAPSFGCGLSEREDEEQTAAPSQTAVVATRRPPCQELSPAQEKVVLKLIDDTAAIPGARATTTSISALSPAICGGGPARFDFSDVPLGHGCERQLYLLALLRDDRILRL